MTAQRIRPATPTDIDRLLDLEERAFPGDRLDRRAFRHAVRSASMAVLVAEDGEAIAGYGSLQFRRGSRVVRLTSLATEPAAAGRGIGRALLVGLEAEAARRGCRAVRLEVRADNDRACTLYERAGYGRLGTVADYYDDGTSAIRLEKSLQGSSRVDG